MSMETPYYQNRRYSALVTKRKYFYYIFDCHLDSDALLLYIYSFFNFSIPALPLEEKEKNSRGLAAVFISNYNVTNHKR